MSRRSLVAGIDAGSARSVALIADDLGNILAQRQGGNVSLSAVGVDASSRSVFQLLTKSCEDARCAIGDLAAVVVGLGGLARDNERLRFVEALNAASAKAGMAAIPAAVESEARVTLEGAFDGGPGVIVISGAGSVVIGKTPKGEVVTAGGWGRILGDEGSGYFIGREALMTIAHEADTHAHSGPLHEVLAQKFHLDTREQIIDAVYQQKLDLAKLAPAVLEIAAHNDIVSQRIVQKAATLLADQVRVVVMRMGILRKVGLVLAGSFLEHEPVYSNVLQMKVIKLLPQVDIRRPLHPPAHGAVRIALERAKKS